MVKGDIITNRKGIVLLIEYNRINQKDCREEPERPDGTVSIMIQSQWQRKLGYGEVKISEATETYCVFAWDLCRLSCFSRNAINKDGCKSSFAFQSKGVVDFKQRSTSIHIL
ncbi:unnamed protein product [Rhizopus microsporus]